MMTLPKRDEPTKAPGTTGTNSKIKHSKSALECSNYDCYIFSDGNYSFPIWVKEGIIKLAPACWDHWLNKPLQTLEEVLIQADFYYTKTPAQC